MSVDRLWMTKGCASCRGPREACYERRVCAYECSAVYSRFGRLPMGAGRGWCAPVPLRIQRLCGFFAVPYEKGRQPSVWFSRTIAGWLSIAAFTLLCPEYTTPHIFSSRTSGCCFLISCSVSSNEVCKNPSLAILATFKARCMSDCSSFTRPPRLAILADMLKTYKSFGAASRVRIGC